MENNTGIMAYQFLIEMENEHHRISEMIMAPKFAKALNEAVDEEDFAIHTSKTNEFISEFVNKAFDNTLKVLDTVSENINRISYNDRLTLVCESKVKSLTLEDRNIVMEECNKQDTLSGVKFDITVDITTVNEALTKVLESSMNNKEEYVSVMKPFMDLVSECSTKLDKIDIDNMERTDVSVMEVSKVLDKFKNTKLSKEKDKSKIDELKEKLAKAKEEAKKKKPAKVKEAVYVGTSYLMRASSVLDKLNTVSHENTVDILTQFINHEVSPEATAHFENTISNLVYPRYMDLEDDEL